MWLRTNKEGKSVKYSKPQMFKDKLPEQVFLKARRITDLKNLGPESEKAFLNAGIKTPAQLVSRRR